MQKQIKEYKTEIIDKYLTGKYTCTDLAKEYGFTQPGISGFLKRNNIEVFKDNSVLNRKYTLNENYFDSIDTEDKAYFLGLLYADGCNHRNSNRVVITLIEKDKHILESFNEYLNHSKPLYFRPLSNKNKNWNDCYALNICSAKISEKLSSLGCVVAKSLILEFPTEEQVPDYLIRHFIRGYFDGDGHFSKSVTKKERNNYNFSIISTYNFCIKLKEICKLKLKINSRIARYKNRNEITCDFRISGYYQVYKFLDWIYEDCTLKLNRKYQRYLDYKKDTSINPNLVENS
jgi:intein-encoded DNA endonuclease-like protein